MITAKESGNVGVVYLINTKEDMTYVLETGGHSPYVAVITPKDFNLYFNCFLSLLFSLSWFSLKYFSKSMIRFKRFSQRISGIVVVDTDHQNGTSPLEFLSADKSCPNENFDLYVNDTTYGHCRQQEWNSEDNSHSEGLLFYDWPFPIFLIKNQTNANEIRDVSNFFQF